MNLDLAHRRKRGIRVLPWVKLLAPLQDADISSRARNAVSGDRPAVSRADHDRRVMVLNLIGWTG
jgi:uncharacterized lipoprotein YddW (UPF0748 family)